MYRGELFYESQQAKHLLNGGIGVRLYKNEKVIFSHILERFNKQHGTNFIYFKSRLFNMQTHLNDEENSNLIAGIVDPLTELVENLNLLTQDFIVHTDEYKEARICILTDALGSMRDCPEDYCEQ